MRPGSGKRLRSGNETTVWECDKKMRVAYNAGDAKVVSFHLGHLNGRAADVPYSHTGKMTTLERKNITVITQTQCHVYITLNLNRPSRLLHGTDATPSEHGGSIPNPHSLEYLLKLPLN